jgi:hypothetical protein
MKGNPMRKYLDAIRRLIRGHGRPIRGVVAAAAFGVLAMGCAPASAPGVVVSPNAPVTATVSDPIAGLAQMATADVQQGISDLIAAGASGPNAPLPLVDSLTCGNWLLTAIPQAQLITAGAIPSFQAKGAYSLFIEGKIAAYHIKGLVGSAQTTLIDQFNHSCGSAVAGDVNAINMLLAKVGIQVAGIAGIPMTGGLSGILGGLIGTLP